MKEGGAGGDVSASSSKGKVHVWRSLHYAVMGSQTNCGLKFPTDYANTQRIRTIEITEPVSVPRTVSFPVRGNINYTQLLVHLHLVLLNVQNITNDSRFSIIDRSR